jgi:hypothetical protein
MGRSMKPGIGVRSVVIAAACLSLAGPAFGGTVSQYIFGYTQGGYDTQPLPELSLNGGAITLDATDSGSYTSTGIHTSSNQQYIVGYCAASDCGTSYTFNDFFVFNLASVISTPITSATLNLYEPSVSIDGYDGYDSNNPSETFQLWDVTTAIGSPSQYGTLEGSDAGDTTGMAIYSDLGSGVFFGSGVVTNAESGTVISFTLDANALAALNTAEGGQFALGGSLSAPEPGSLVMMAGGLAAVAWKRRGRTR